ncbi:hypothetical protein EMCRGX_G026038 [Ephydatia muelleri]
MATVPSTSRSAEDPISASEIQRTPYDRSDRNLDTIPPHQLQPCLKSICEELKRLRRIVEVLQAEQKKMAGSMTKFFESSFSIETCSFKEELCVQLAVLFCNNVRRDPSKSDINDMLGRVMGVDAVIPHKLQKALKFCNKKLADMRSEERRRLFGTQPCQGFLTMNTKQFAERFLVTYKVSLADNLEMYTKHLALMRTFVRTTGDSSREKTHKKFEKWIVTVFHGDPSTDDLSDIAANDAEFDYGTASAPVAPLSGDFN